MCVCIYLFTCASCWKDDGITAGLFKHLPSTHHREMPYARNYQPKSQSVDGIGCLIQNSLRMPELRKILITCVRSGIVSFYLSTRCPIISWISNSYPYDPLWLFLACG